MGGLFMFQKWKKFGCCLFILTALPYIITIFINGPLRLTAPKQEEKEVSVRTADADGKIKLLSLDEYGMGILAKEIPMDMELEAVKAQAVVVRTGMYKKLSEQTEKKKETVFTDDFLSINELEDEWGRLTQEYYNKLTKAWNETKEKILVYEGKPAYTPFCRLTNGKTRDGKEALGTEKYPYLKSVECEGDVKAEGGFQSKEIDGEGYEIAKTDSTGYVLEIKQGDKTMDGDTFRDTWKLASSSFTLKEEKGKGKTRVTTKGVGHGLGLSQNTADILAKEGKDYKEILEYFFEGTRLLEVAEILKEPE